MYIFSSVVGQNNIVAALGRSFSTDDDIGNLLTRTIIDDQIDVLGVRILYDIHFYLK